MNHRLARKEKGPLLGVCEGIAQYLNVEPMAVRIVWLISVLFFGSGVLFYLFLAVLMPHESKIYDYYRPKFLGIAHHLAYRNQIDLSLIRIMIVAGAFMSLGLVLFAYLVLYLLLPIDETSHRRLDYGV